MVRRATSLSNDGPRPKQSQTRIDAESTVEGGMSEFDSLTLALEEWFDRPLGDLPEALRLRAGKELKPHRWDELAPEQRRTLALQLDYQHDPATEREREYWWDFFHRMSALEAELRQESSDRVNLDELLGTGGRKSEIRTQIELMKARERASKDHYYPQRRVPLQEPLVGRYMAYPKALGHLRQRLKATAEELAAWVCWRRPKTEPLLRVVPTQN